MISDEDLLATLEDEEIRETASCLEVDSVDGTDGREVTSQAEG